MIYLTGDINLTDNAFDIGFGIGSKIKDGFNPFQFLNKKNDDCWIGNFEGVLSDTTDRRGYHRDEFRVTSQVYNQIIDIIDIYGLANNHVMEHGELAYNQMIQILGDSQKNTFGMKSARSIIVENCEKKVSITGLSLREDGTGNSPSYWNYPDMLEIESEVNKLNDCNFRIVYIHWGVEFIDFPSIGQIRFAHWLIDIGFDLIIGMHPHVLQGFEIYKGKHIFYSLGNFVFNMTYEPSLYGAIVKLNTEDLTIDYDYVKIDKDFCPHIVSQDQVPTSYRFLALNQKIGKILNVEKYVAEANKGLTAYQKHNRMEILRNFSKYNKRVLLSIIVDFLKRRF